MGPSSLDKSMNTKRILCIPAQYHVRVLVCSNPMRNSTNQLCQIVLAFLGNAVAFCVLSKTDDQAGSDQKGAEEKRLGLDFCDGSTAV